MNDASKFAEIANWAAKASLGTLLLAILALGQSGVWVWGSQYVSMKAERDEWRAIALKAAHLAEESTFHVVGEPSPLQGVREKIRELEAAKAD